MRTVKGAIWFENWWNVQTEDQTVMGVANRVVRQFSQAHNIQLEAVSVDSQNAMVILPWADSDTARRAYHPVIWIYCNEETIANHTVTFGFGIANRSGGNDHVIWNAGYNYDSVSFPGVGETMEPHAYRYRVLNIPSLNSYAYAYSCSLNIPRYIPNVGLITQCTKLTTQDTYNMVVQTYYQHTSQSINFKVFDANIIERVVQPPIVEETSEGIMIYPLNDGFYKNDKLYCCTPYFELLNNLINAYAYPTENDIVERAFTINGKVYNLFQTIYMTDFGYGDMSVVYESR